MWRVTTYERLGLREETVDEEMEDAANGPQGESFATSLSIPSPLPRSVDLLTLSIPTGDAISPEEGQGASPNDGSNSSADANVVANILAADNNEDANDSEDADDSEDAESTTTIRAAYHQAVDEAEAEAANLASTNEGQGIEQGAPPGAHGPTVGTPFTHIYVGAHTRAAGSWVIDIDQWRLHVGAAVAAAARRRR